MQTSSQTACPVRNIVSNEVKKRSSLTGFTWFFIHLFGLITILTILPFALAQEEDSILYRAALQNYSQDNYAQAAKGFLELMEKFPQSQYSSRSAYMFNIIVLDKISRLETGGFLSQLPQIDKGYLKTLEAIAVKNKDEAIADAAYLILKSEGKISPSRLLVEDLLARLTDKLSGPYLKWWSKQLPDVVNIDIDAEDNLWALVNDHLKLVKLDELGEIKTEMRLYPSEEIYLGDGTKSSFIVSGDGTFIVNNACFLSSGQEKMRYPFERATDIEVDKDGSIYVLYLDGLRKYDVSGSLIFKSGLRGLKKGRFLEPNGLAVDEALGIVVADQKRLQVFDAEGKAKFMVANQELLGAWALDPMDRILDFSGRLSDVEIDRNHFIYAADFYNNVYILDNNFNQVAFLSQPAHKIKVSSQGVVYCLLSDTITAYLPVNGGVYVSDLPKTELALAVSTLPFSEKIPSREIQVKKSFTSPANFKIYTNSQEINQVIQDPRNHSVLWLATRGGLLRYDIKQNQWRRWTSQDGLISNEVNIVFVDFLNNEIWTATNSGVCVFGEPSFRWEKVEDSAGALSGAGVRRIIADPLNKGVLWFAADDGLIKYERGQELWRLFPTFTSLKEIIPLPQRERGGFLLLSQTHLLRFDSFEEKIQPLCDVDDLTDIAGRQDQPQNGISLVTMRLEIKGGQTKIWLLTSNDGVFIYDLDERKISYPSFNRFFKNSSRGDLRAAYFSGQHRHFSSSTGASSFLGEIDKAENWKEIAHIPDRYISQFIADYDNPHKFWLASDKGLVSYDLADQRLDIHRPPGQEPGGSNIAVLKIVNGKLWVGSGDGPLSVFDLQSSVWKIFPETFCINRIKPLSKGNRILCFEQCGYERIFSVDTTDLVVQQFNLGQELTGCCLRDIEYDGEYYWAVGGKEEGLWMFSKKETKHLTKDDGLIFEEGYQVIQDRYHRQYLWISTDKGLVRFNKTTKENVAIDPLVRSIDYFGGVFLWGKDAQGRIVKYNFAQEKFSRLNIGGEFYVDEETPELLWLAANNWIKDQGQVRLIDSRSENMLHSFHLTPYTVIRNIAVTGGPQPKIFLGSYEGIVEIDKFNERKGEANGHVR